MGASGGRSTGILIGSVLGVVMALIAGGQDVACGPGVYVSQVLGLGVGLLDGLGAQRVRRYRDARESRAGAYLDIPEAAPHDASMVTLGSQAGDQRNERLVSRTPLRGTPSELNPEAAPFRITPNRSDLAPGVDPCRLNQLGDELEVRSFVSRMNADHPGRLP